MESEQLKLQYARAQMEKGIRDIFARQLQIAQDGIYSAAATQARERRTGRLSLGRSGSLLAALQSPHFSVTEKGGGVEATVQLPEYSRFVDMRKHGNKKIYNKPVFGILYKEVLSSVKYEFREWLQQQRQLLAQTTEPQ